MLSQGRTFTLTLVYSYRTLDQIPDQKRFGLQNVEVNITFRTARDAADWLSKITGSVDPFSVKREIASTHRRCRLR